jgi:hypothetical protein
MRVALYLPTVAILLALGGCSSKVDDAAEQFAFLEQRGADDVDLCQAAGAVLMAATEEKDSDAYDEWRVRQSLHCLRAQNDGLM